MVVGWVVSVEVSFSHLHHLHHFLPLGSLLVQMEGDFMLDSCLCPDDCRRWKLLVVLERHWM